MHYDKLAERLAANEIILLDGGTGTELERRGAKMDPQAWCGTATLENVHILEAIHRDYIDAGADVITANTFASSRIMLEPAGAGPQFADINKTAVHAAQNAARSAGNDIWVAGSLSHMMPVMEGTAIFDPARVGSPQQMEDAFFELASLLRDEGCDFILLEMMYAPDRFARALSAALSTGLPVWAGFSVRRNQAGDTLGFSVQEDVPFEELVTPINRRNVQAAGVMHSPSQSVADAVDLLKKSYSGPLMAYPDSGYFKMPSWQFENIIPPEELKEFARGWIDQGVQIVGGCCGITPEHIAALNTLR
jgi:homocysteine S-methyltransferase